MPAALAVGLVIFAVVVADLGTAVVLGVAASSCSSSPAWNGATASIAAVVALLGVVRLHRRASPTGWRRVVSTSTRASGSSRRSTRNGKIKAQTGKVAALRATPAISLQQSKIAVGAGGALGVGLMNGRQKLLYLPEAHTDFIYAVVGEEMGLIGTSGCCSPSS